MDTTLLIVILVCTVLICGTILLVFLKRPAAPASTGLEALAGQLQGQLAAMTAAQSASQSAIEARLGTITESVQDRLSNSTAETGKSLAELKERLAVIDAAQKNIAELSGRVVDLQEVFTNKQARGAFGEVQLQDIVQGMLASSQYEFQATLKNGKRVDCLLKLPTPPGSLGVDAKFPLEAYRAIREAKDEAALIVARREFTVAIRAHVKAIAEKYIVPGETADCALMFLPSEAVYCELHDNFQGLVDEAARLKVWIVSPTTMMATLTTMRAILKDVRMREQAHVIQAMVGDLMADMDRLDNRVTKLQSHFDQAVDDVRQIRISTDKVIKRAGKIQNVGLEDADAAELSTSGTPSLLPPAIEA